MTITEAANHFQVNRKTILSICKDPVLSAAWGCVMESGRWTIKTPPLSDRWYKPDRVARIMEKSRIQVFRWCRSGTIRAIRVGRNYRIPKAELLKIFYIRD